MVDRWLGLPDDVLKIYRTMLCVCSGGKTGRMNGIDAVEQAVWRVLSVLSCHLSGSGCPCIFVSADTQTSVLVPVILTIIVCVALDEDTLRI